MHIICTQENLLNSINIVLKAVSTKTTLPILQCILLKTNDVGVTLVGTNLELGIESNLDANIIEEGTIALEAKIFSEIIRKMPSGEVELKLDVSNHMVTIICQKSKFKIASHEVSVFPKLPKIATTTEYSIEQCLLKDMIRQTIFSVSQEDTRPVLTGELFEIRDGLFNVVAVDGFRIAYRCTSVEGEMPDIAVVVPAKTLNEISKILLADPEEIKFYVDENHIMFDLGESRVVSRLLEGEFLKYQQVFSQDYETCITLNRKQLLMSIERAALISREGKKNPIKIEINEEQMVITSQTELGAVREELDIVLQGKRLNIAFNPKYLIEILKAIEEEVVVINFISSLTPCIIRPEIGNHFKYLVLPIRLKAD
ncbi:MAG: DNA polymerase III subunit beta [Epulopiscium sp. Nele67-Bin005]|nr:MAG: DNA polymerase III subunit beta [Epulopiscium sp. Nele67-Bin005]